MARTQDFQIIYGAKLGKQIQPVDADLYGGGANPAIGAGDLMRFDELKFEDTPDFFEDAAKNGTLFEIGQEIAAVPISIQGETKVYTQGLESLFLACFGFEDLNGPVNYSTTEYSHLFSLTTNGKDQREYTASEAADATANVAFSPAYASGDYINSYINFVKRLGPSDVRIGNASIQEFTFSAASKEPLKLSFSGPAEAIARDTNKSYSNNLSIASGAFQEYFLLRHVDAVTFGPIGLESTRDIFDFSIKVSHGQADLFPTGTINSGKARSEPVSTGMTEVTLEMTINKHDTDDFKTWEQAGTICECLISFTRGVDRIIFLMPHLVVKSQEIEESDGSKIKITCKGYQPTGADPFTTARSISGSEQTLEYTTPLYMMVSNQFSGNSLRVSS